MKIIAIIAAILAALNVLSVWAAVMINHDENDKEELENGQRKGYEAERNADEF